MSKPKELKVMLSCHNEVGDFVNFETLDFNLKDTISEFFKNYKIPSEYFYIFVNSKPVKESYVLNPWDFIQIQSV